jgi:hypothetical protein
MDWIKDLIEAIPWGRLSENAVLIVVSLFLIVAVVYLYLKYKEKRIEIDKTIIEAAQTVESNISTTRLKEIEKYDKSINVVISKEVHLDEVTIGNTKGDEKANIKVTVQEGSRIKKSRIGNINGS